MKIPKVPSHKSTVALYLSICQIVFQWSQVDGLAIDKTQPSSQTLQQTQTAAIASQNQPSNSNTQPSTRPSDSRRPIWALAHMVNSIKELEYRLEKGANAVEADVTFSREGDPLYTYHGPPCDCWRHCHQQEDLNEYLRYVREVSIDEVDGIGKNLTMLFLDLKLDYLDQRAKARAGVELAKSIAGNLFLDSPASQTIANERRALQQSSNSNDINGTREEASEPRNMLRLILSVNHVSDNELVNNFVHYLDEHNSSHLLSRIGFDVGMNDDIQQIESMWKKFGNTLNLWQGDGYTNCFSPFYNLERLSRALSKRDSIYGYPRKVYHWTIDLHDRMRESLKLGVDAVMTNHPERLLSILQEPDLAHDFRLATRDDDPFQKIVYRSGSRSSESARYQRSTSAANGGFFGNIIDVISSWFTYIKEIPFLSLPTTSRFMPKVKRHKSAAPTSSMISFMGADAGKSSQPEYRVDAGTNSSLQTTQDEANGTTTTTEKPYEGPKWYTSLASNLLVSMLKILLPVQ